MFVTSKYSKIKWPKISKGDLIEEDINFVVQVNGKKRAILKVKRDIIEKEILETIKLNREIAKFINNQKIKKSIWIDQLLHRLVFEVNICNHTTSRTAVFCVLELVKEVYYAKAGAIDKLVFNVDGSDIRLQKAFVAIEGELDFLWTAEKLGKGVGTSTATLGRLFKNEFGVSTMEFIWDLRLRKAFALLNNTSMAIGEVAFAVGFESLTGFSTSFKRKFGFSPKSLKMKVDL